MELRQYVNVLLKWWWLILASVIVAGASAYFATKATPNTYVSRTTIMVGQLIPVTPNSSTGSGDFGSAQTISQIGQVYSDLATREPVLQDVLKAVGLPWDWTVLQGMVQSRVVPGTTFIEISVTDTDPQRTKVLADEVANQLILRSTAAPDPETRKALQFMQTQLDDLQTKVEKAQSEMTRLDDVISKATSARQIQDARDQQTNLQAQINTWRATYAQLYANLQQRSPNYLTVIEAAQLPSRPTGPRLVDNMLLAAAIGLVLSAAGAFLLEYIDDTIHSPEDVRAELGLATMGSIAIMKGKDYPSKLMPLRQPRSPVSEAYRMLRANLQFTNIDHPLHTLVVTSCGPLEGKSITSANLSIVMAQSGKRVILVDADLRRPTQQRVFNLKGAVGLTTLLLDPALQLDQVLQPSGITDLMVLTSGLIPPNPSELLSSKRMADVTTALCERADLVIFDSPPTLAISDAPVLSTRSDGVLLVVQAGRTRRAAAKQAKEALTAVGANLIGVVLNRLSIHSTSYYHYYSAADESGPSARRGIFPRLKLRRTRPHVKKSPALPIVTDPPQPGM
jgi:capsular exopolysaccharide synthesis family protein